MRKQLQGKFLLPLLLSCAVVFVSCKDDAYLAAAAPLPDASFTEEFDTVTAAYNRGWRYINVSDPKGTGFWTQGLFNDPNITGFPGIIPFPAYSSKGGFAGYIGADYTSTSAAAGIISTWVVSPLTLLKNNDKIIFYTKGLILPTATADSTDYANRVQVRISVMGESTNTGSGDDPGDFKSALLDINPFYRYYHSSSSLYDPTAYPAKWTRFEATVSGLNGAVKGRFAFRYYVEGGGSNGLGTAVAIDHVSYISAK
jgi:hypothetical protein